MSTATTEFTWLDAFDKIMARGDRHLDKNNHQVHFVSYAAYKTDKKGQPIDNLDKIAVKGKCRFVQRRCEFYGGPNSKNYKSRVVENPTWLQLCALANSMIIKTLDTHHVFLEGVHYLRKDKDGVKIYEFVMGS